PVFGASCDAVSGLCLTFTATPTPTSTPTPLFPLSAPNCVGIGANGNGDAQPQNFRIGCEENWECARLDDGDGSYVASSFANFRPRADLSALDTPPSRAEPIHDVTVHVRSRSVQGLSGDNVNTQLKVAGFATIYSGLPQPVTNTYAEYTRTYGENP